MSTRREDYELITNLTTKKSVGLYRRRYLNYRRRYLNSIKESETQFFVNNEGKEYKLIPSKEYAMHNLTEAKHYLTKEIIYIIKLIKEKHC